ncbi:MAG: flagellar protein FliT [Pseudomonadota bacterium]
MSSDILLQPLKQLLVQAQLLLQLAQAENWEEMQTQFSEYQQQMLLLADATYLQTLKEENLAAEAQEFIVKIQELNQQLDSFAEQAHADIASELRQFIQADKALDAYSR